MQENTDKQCNDVRNKINKNNLLSKIEIKKIQIQILEMKNSVKIMKKEIASLGKRANQIKQIISDI